MDIEMAQAHADHEARRNKILGKIELALPEDAENEYLQIYQSQAVELFREIKEFLEEGDI